MASPGPTPHPHPVLSDHLQLGWRSSLNQMGAAADVLLSIQNTQRSKQDIEENDEGASNVKEVFDYSRQIVATVLPN